MLPGSVLSDPDLSRLASLLGMTGSANDNEALNAVRLANKFIREHSLTWRELLTSVEPEPTPEPKRPAEDDVLLDWPVRWQAAAQLCASAGEGLLREKDVAFARTVAGYGHRPSDKQLAYLADLVRKVVGGRPA